MEKLLCVCGHIWRGNPHRRLNIVHPHQACSRPSVTCTHRARIAGPACHDGYKQDSLFLLLQQFQQLLCQALRCLQHTAAGVRGQRGVESAGDPCTQALQLPLQLLQLQPAQENNSQWQAQPFFVAQREANRSCNSCKDMLRAKSEPSILKTPWLDAIHQPSPGCESLMLNSMHCEPHGYHSGIPDGLAR